MIIVVRSQEFHLQAELCHLELCPNIDSQGVAPGRQLGRKVSEISGLWTQEIDTGLPAPAFIAP